MKIHCDKSIVSFAGTGRPVFVSIHKHDPLSEPKIRQLAKSSKSSSEEGLLGQNYTVSFQHQDGFHHDVDFLASRQPVSFKPGNPF